MNNTSSTDPVIDVKHLAKTFNEIQAVKNLTLKIHPGTIFGILGANGSGKTTSLRLLCGLILPDKGEGHCLGLNLFTQTKLIQAQIGYMPQKFCLYQNLSIYENLDFIARIYSLKNRKKRLEEILDIYSLTEKQNQLTNTLSGGWQQRVALAAALLHKPRILLLDEPTSGLDPQSRLVIWDHIQALASQNTTILVSTHHMDEAERCHQLAYMSFGKIIAHGTAEDITHSINLYTWRISGRNFSALKESLKPYSDTLQLIEKGNEIRLNALHADALNNLDSSILQNYKIQKTETTLEDVFIFKLRKEEKGS